MVLVLVADERRRKRRQLSQIRMQHMTLSRNLSDINRVLYGVYTIAGWCAGPVLNYIKPKWTVVLGGIGYPLYVGSLWYYARAGGQAFPITSGAILGVCAALIWTALGFIQFAYAEEKDKASYITWQWMLMSSGSTVGALIALFATMKQTEAIGVSNAVYIAFIVIMVTAIVAASLLIVHPATFVRDDGRHLAIFTKPALKDEIMGVVSVITDPKIVILLPAMLVGEMCLALTSSINASYFNLRTRSLNNLLFQCIMIPAPVLLACIMDNHRVQSRRIRGIMGTSAVGIVAVGANSGLLAWVIENNVTRDGTSPAVDWTDAAFILGIILYLLFGITFACFQISVQWTLAALTNNPAICARYTGAFKGTVSLGMCISFTVDSQGMTFRNQIIMQLVPYVLCIVCLLYVIIVYVKQTNYFVEEGVIVPTAVEELHEKAEEAGGLKEKEQKKMLPH